MEPFGKNEVFCLCWRNTYFNEHYLVTAPPASSEQKYALCKHCIQTKTPLPPAKTPNYIVLFISPDDYDITVNRKENTNVLMLLNFLHFTEAAISICSVKKVFTTCSQKNLEFSQWLWLLTIINFIITQLFTKHQFLKNISAWLFLTSKFFSEWIGFMFWP